MGKRGQEEAGEQAPKREGQAKEETQSMGPLREAVNAGEYGIDYQRSDYEDAAKQSEESGHSPIGED